MDTTHSTNMATLDRWAALRGPASAAPTLTLVDLGHLDCTVVETDGQRQRWDTLLTREHWLGPGPLVGATLRYLIRSEFFGDVAALSFSAPALRLSARDAFIG